MPTLDWLNLNEFFHLAERVPTRVLQHHPADAAFGDASAGDLLIQGDSLAALKALRPLYRGRVKCMNWQIEAAPALVPPGAGA